MDVRQLNEGRTPTNGGIEELIERSKPPGPDLANLNKNLPSGAEIITPDNPILSMDGLPIANDKTWE